MAERITWTQVDTLQAPDAPAARVTFTQIEVLIGPPTAYAAGQNPDVPFTY